jgi:serine/threonine protein phosphatase PrpC
MLAVIAFPSAAATHDGGAPYQQDRAAINPDTRTIGVFDGHGDYGDLAAQTAADTVAASSADTSFADLFGIAEEAIRDAMRTRIKAEGKPLHEFEGALYRTYTPWSGPQAQYRGGTTASVLRIAADGSLSVANVGDSDIVVFDGPSVTHGDAGHRDPGRTLIADHTPTSLPEWERVHAARPTTRFRFNNPHQPWGPDRPVWVPRAILNPETDRPWQLNPAGGFMYTDVRNTWGAYVTVHDGSESLAMTRALGDFHLKRHGVIATPEIQTAPAPAPGTTRAVILGSDGVWDTLQFEAARELVYRAEYQGRPDEATAALLELARTTAHSKFGPVVDNLVCAVVYITVPAAEEAGGAAEAPAADAQSLSCELHGPLAQPGGCGLWYSMNERGEYGMYAPPCNGCPYGTREQARVAARFQLEDAMGAARRDPTEPNKERLRAAIEAIEPWASQYDYLVEIARELLTPADTT